MGTLMFSENTEHSVQSITECIGLAVAYITTMKQMYSMSAGASKQLKQIGLDWSKKFASFHVVYNNINQYQKVWQPSIESHTELESGTAAALTMQPGVAPEAFNGYKYDAQ